MQLNQTYVPEEASVQVNKLMEQVLLHNCSAIPDYPAAWETLPQRESVKMEVNQAYVPEEVSVQVNKHMEQIYYNQVLLQNYPAIPDCPASWETLPQGESVEMQFYQTYFPEEVSVQARKPMEQIYYSQVLQQNCSAIPDYPATRETLIQRENVVQFQQETEKTMKNQYSKGQRSSEGSLSYRREKNRHRERKRQTRLKGAFNVLRSVIPDHFSAREPGDRLSRIQTLRLAKKYIATLQELLETC